MRAILAGRAPELLLTALFVALVAPVIAAGGTGTAGYEDERVYHGRTVVELAADLPSPDLENIHTATTPGLHLVTAVFVRLVSDDRAAVEAFAALFSLAMILVAYRLIRRYAGRWPGLFLTLPLLLSHYVLQSAAWLNTDNTAMLFILLTLGAALTVAETGRGLFLGGLWVLLGASVRQLALWAAGPLVFAAAVAGRWIPGLREEPGGGPAERRPSLRPLVLAGVAVIPAIAMLAAFASLWGQLTPPIAAGQSGTSPAAVPFTLALAGLFAPFFAACVATREDLRERRALAGAAAAGALLALAVPTSHDATAERRTGGGLWSIVRDTPAVADRSLTIAILAGLGAALLVVLWRAAARNAMQRPAAVVLVAIASVAIAQAGTVRTYQRYFEPPVIACLALLAALAGLDRRRATVGLGALCVLQLAGCVAVVYSAL
ncbi:MAG TPA: glycosyltransferase family 39 protein [Thermoleophilaceae bacterium]